MPQHPIYQEVEEEPKHREQRQFYRRWKIVMFCAVIVFGIFAGVSWHSLHKQNGDKEKSDSCCLPSTCNVKALNTNDITSHDGIHAVSTANRLCQFSANQIQEMGCAKEFHLVENCSIMEGKYSGACTNNRGHMAITACAICFTVVAFLSLLLSAVCFHQGTYCYGEVNQPRECGHRCMRVCTVFMWLPILGACITAVVFASIFVNFIWAHHGVDAWDLFKWYGKHHHSSNKDWLPSWSSGCPAATPAQSNLFGQTTLSIQALNWMKPEKHIRSQSMFSLLLPVFCLFALLIMLMNGLVKCCRHCCCPEQESRRLNQQLHQVAMPNHGTMNTNTSPVVTGVVAPSGYAKCTV